MQASSAVRECACALDADDGMRLSMALGAVAGYVASVLSQRLFAARTCDDAVDARARDEMAALEQQVAALDTMDTMHLRARVQRRLMTLRRERDERVRAQQQQRQCYTVTAIASRWWRACCGSTTATAAATRLPSFLSSTPHVDNDNGNNNNNNNLRPARSDGRACAVALVYNTAQCAWCAVHDVVCCARHYAPALVLCMLRGAYVLYALMRVGGDARAVSAACAAHVTAVSTTTPTSQGGCLCSGRGSSRCRGATTSASGECAVSPATTYGMVLWWALLCYMAVYFAMRVLR